MLYYGFMSRIVNQDMINEWIANNAPQGHEKLSVKAKLAFPTVGMVRRGHVPKEHTRRKLASILGTTEDILFPLVTASGGVAS